jgi:hypothetical protein
MDKVQLSITCQGCQKDFALDKDSSVRIIKQAAVQFAIKCPHCQVHTHSYFHTRRIQAAQVRLKSAEVRMQNSPNQYSRDANERSWLLAKADHQRTFDAEQERLNNKYGVKRGETFTP